VKETRSSLAAAVVRKEVEWACTAVSKNQRQQGLYDLFSCESASAQWRQV